jgi:hypothetical protein
MTGSRPRIFLEEGQRFGRLVVLQATDVKVGVSAARPEGRRAVICRCDCGEIVTTAIRQLVSGQTKSCGCLKRDATEWDERALRDRSYAVTHGLHAHPLYDTWYGMMARCHNSRNKAYRNYGARGIRVHEPWHDLAAFIADIEASIGPRPEGRTPGGKPLYTLDRWPDNDGGYEPGNVRWATAKEQAANTRQPPRGLCSEEGCRRLVHARGLCNTHYMRWLKVGRSAAA